MNNYNNYNNYNDNQIQIYNELLQLNANKYNKNIVNELNLNKDINLNTYLIKQNQRKLFIKNFLIVFMLKMLYLLLAIIIPIGLYVFGFISLKYGLIFITFIILIYIIILIYTSNNNNIKINKSFNFTNAKKINNFSIKNDNTNDTDDDTDDNTDDTDDNTNDDDTDDGTNENSSINSNVNILEKNNLQIRKNINSFYYDNSLPYKFYI
jgi:hypothetical protein